MTEDVLNKLFNKISNNYIFIYTPPKVGSTTLVSSLRISLGSSYNIIHIHDDIMLRVLTNNNEITVKGMIEHLLYKGKHVYIIDVYREPIERKISEYFEKISCYHFNNSEENINNYNISRVINRFNKLFPHLSTEEHYFDKYDIEDPVPFNFNKKYSLQILNRIKYIKLRLMDSNSWSKILTEIFNTKIVIINDYQTNNKVIGKLYRKFKEEYRIPNNFLDQIKTCKYFNFYLSEQERNEYIQKWSTKVTSECNPFTSDEYKFYLNICLENQYYNDIQVNHYIDEGCGCKHCKIKRKNIYLRAYKGEQIHERIMHTEVINNVITNKNNILLNAVKTIKSKINTKTNKLLLYNQPK